MNIESADGRRRFRSEWPFPRAWGPPPANATPAILAGWARANIVEGEIRRAAGERVPWLAPTRLERRDVPVAIQHRRRLLDLRARQQGPT
jgi:hypothetical protein